MALCVCGLVPLPSGAPDLLILLPIPPPLRSLPTQAVVPPLALPLAPCLLPAPWPLLLLPLPPSRPPRPVPLGALIFRAQLSLLLLSPPPALLLPTTSLSPLAPRRVVDARLFKLPFLYSDWTFCPLLTLITAPDVARATVPQAAVILPIVTPRSCRICACTRLCVPGVTRALFGPFKSVPAVAFAVAAPGALQFAALNPLALLRITRLAPRPWSSSTISRLSTPLSLITSPIPPFPI